MLSLVTVSVGIELAVRVKLVALIVRPNDVAFSLAVLSGKDWFG